MVGDPNTRPAALRNWPWLIPIALAGFLLAVFGTYWDDAWHTEEGRDSFLSPPHLALYAGIALAGGALSVWALLAARRVGLRRALEHRPLLLALAGVVVTLAGAPADNAWHEAFGRDAVIWSPPHMLGVAGSLAIAAGLLLELADAPPSPFGHPAGLLAAAAVVAVAAVPVLEYETDVPQFDLAFYLPVLATGAAYALGLALIALPGRGAAARAALAYTAVIALVGLVLLAMDMPAPLLPLLVIPALTLDVAARRVPRLGAAAAFVLSLYLAYVPYLNWVKSDLHLDLADVVTGLPLAFVGVLVALWLTSPPRAGRGGPSPTVAVVALVALFAPVPSARAHDPGQGEELATASILARADGERAELEVDLSGSGHCDDLTPQQLVARRAGETLSAPLRKSGPCRVAGEITLPDRGRWFLYAELDHDGDVVETWLPVHADGAETVADEARSVYSPPEVTDPPLKSAAGIAIYGILLGTVVGVPVLYRRTLGAQVP